MSRAENPEAPEKAIKKALEFSAPVGAEKKAEKLNLDDFDSLVTSMSCAVRMFKAHGNDSDGLDYEEYIGLLDALADTVLLYATKMHRAIFGEDEVYI